MPESKLLLCTDMDRTIIPNGIQPEPLDARKHFNSFCLRPDVKLVYVTGRHAKLVRQAIKNYSLPRPDYVITDVGTQIYRVVGNQWQQMEEWEAEIDQDWHGKTHANLKALLKPVSELRLQESSKQNTHKLSYYLPLYLDKDSIIERMNAFLFEAGIDASIIWSIDEPMKVGLIDVLPRHATKLHAIYFLQAQLDFSAENVVFAGDSGNDLPVLTSEVQSILVDNARDDIKTAAVQLSNIKGHGHALYLAHSQPNQHNGNYAGGVLQGVKYFCPDMLPSTDTEVRSDA